MPVECNTLFADPYASVDQFMCKKRLVYVRGIPIQGIPSLDGGGT